MGGFTFGVGAGFNTNNGLVGSIAVHERAFTSTENLLERLNSFQNRPPNGTRITNGELPNLVPLARYGLMQRNPKVKAEAGDEGDFRRLLERVNSMPVRAFNYQRPSYQPGPDVFHDLVAYAPGLNTNSADVLGLLDAEAISGAWNKLGTIEPAARKLIEQARPAGWQVLTLPAASGQPAITIHFDGRGKFAYERVLPIGLRERVVCDGRTLTHLYPQLALAARREVTRFHRAGLAAMVPWFVPPADELARGADVKLAGPRSVDIIPHGIASLPKDATYHVVRLIFADDGRLAARRIVKMPGNETVYTLTLSTDGQATLTDGKGKEQVVQNGELRMARPRRSSPIPRTCSSCRCRIARRPMSARCTSSRRRTTMR